VLAYPSSIDLSSRTLCCPTRQLVVRRRAIGARWRRLPTGRQALLTPAHLLRGDTYAQLAAEFGIEVGVGVGVATVYRYTRVLSVDG
jgi:hypothetical protein